MKNNYVLGLLAFVAINTIIAVGLNLVMGYAGQVSLGHAAFFGIGAYTSAILTTQHHCNPWLALLAGVVITCTIALAVGIPCLRLSGHYLAMATLGFGWIIYTVMLQWDAVDERHLRDQGHPETGHRAVRLRERYQPFLSHLGVRHRAAGALGKCRQFPPGARAARVAWQRGRRRHARHQCRLV